MARKSKVEIAQKTKLADKLRALASELIDEIQELRRQKEPIDVERYKIILLTIREIRELVKMDEKSQISDLLDVDLLDLSEIEHKEGGFNDEEEKE